MKFRFKALERKRQPDKLDSPLLLASPRGWVAVFTVLITTVMIGIWGFLGAVPRAEAASGLLVYPGGISTIEAGGSGTVQSVKVHQGTKVRPGQTLLTMRTTTGKPIPVRASAQGRVVAIMTSPGMYAEPGTPLLQIEQAKGEPLQVTLLIDARMVPYVHVNQSVTMAVPGTNPRTHGRLKGTVDAVSPFPATDEEIAAVSGRQTHESAGIQHMVRVSLHPDKTNPSGYAWTSSQGPPIRLESRTPVEAELSLGSWKPISILLGD